MAYLESEQDIGWEDLSQAIILQAVEDYREAWKRRHRLDKLQQAGDQAGLIDEYRKMQKLRETYGAKESIAFLWPDAFDPDLIILDVEVFITSRWFATLTTLDPFDLLRRLREENDPA